MPTSLCTPCCRLFGFELCIADCVVVFTSLHFSSQDKSEFLTRNLIRHMLIQAQQLSDEQKVCVWGTTDNRFRLWQGQCQVPNAKCAMPNAKCQMPNAQMSNAHQDTTNRYGLNERRAAATILTIKQIHPAKKQKLR